MHSIKGGIKGVLNGDVPRWKVALAIGVPATVGLVGLWFYRQVFNGRRLREGRGGRGVSIWNVALAIGVPATIGLCFGLCFEEKGREGKRKGRKVGGRGWSGWKR